MNKVIVKYPISKQLLELKKLHAGSNLRGRSMHIICGGPDHPMQALLNTLLNGSYVRPHRHKFVERFECIEGTFKIVTWDESGNLTTSLLVPENVLFIPANTWHTLVCISDYGTVYETKECYFDAATDKEFMPGTPEEFTVDANAFLTTLTNA